MSSIVQPAGNTSAETRWSEIYFGLQPGVIESCSGNQSGLLLLLTSPEKFEVCYVPSTLAFSLMHGCGTYLVHRLAS